MKLPVFIADPDKLEHVKKIVLSKPKSWLSQDKGLLVYSILVLFFENMVSQCRTQAQEWVEGGSRELQACWLDLGAQDDYGAGILSAITRRGQPGDQAFPAWI